jgi:hypothetical protein
MNASSSKNLIIQTILVTDFLLLISMTQIFHVDYVDDDNVMHQI